MKLRELLATGVGAVGIAVAGNAALQHRAGDLEPALSGEQRTYRWRGMDVAYTEAGDPEAESILLLHGINAAAGNWEFESVFADLAEDYHVIAPDLPGFGRSDRPPIEYDAELYVDFVREFGDDIAPGSACVASSLVGAYATLAQRETGVFSRLVLICPTATTVTLRQSWLRRLLRAPVIGTALFNIIASKPSIRYFSAEQSFHDPRRVDEAEVDYQWRTAHQSGARYAPASFVSGYLDAEADLGGVLSAVEAPVTLVWGRDAEITPVAYGRDLAEAGDARLVVFDNAKLLPHVEHAGRFREELRAELAGNVEPASPGER